MELLQAGFYFFPTPTLLMFFGLVGALIGLIHLPRQPIGKWLCLLPSVLPPGAIGLIGVVCAYGGDSVDAPIWPQYTIFALLLAQFPVAVAQVFVWRRNPLVAIGWAGIWLWLSLPLAFLSEMSVQNDWL